MSFKFISTSIEDYKSIVEKSFNKEKKVSVICVQGASTSGKTTLAKRLEKELINNGKRVFCINTDSFYLDIDPEHNYYTYDFDNPAAFDWNKLIGLIQDIHDEKQVLTTYNYCYVTNSPSLPVLIENPKPDYVIIEGIYALYLFSKVFFDLKYYDPTEFNQGTKFVANKKIFANFNILGILLTICKGKMTKIRTNRDMATRGRSEESVRMQIERHVWPATIKWVYNEIVNPDIVINHGTFNEKNTTNLIKTISEFVQKEDGMKKVEIGEFCDYCCEKDWLVEN